MDLISGQPYWLIKNGLLSVYNNSDASCSTQVAILGGGISGALMAHALIKKGIECVIIESHGIGLGSTCANTALLQYETDLPLEVLAKKKGMQNAIEIYKLGANAVDALINISEEIGSGTVTSCQSVYFAHKATKTKFLQREYAFRRDAGFEVKLLDATELFKLYGLHSGSGILSNKAAQADPYLFTQHLVAHNNQKGLKILDYTKIRSKRYRNRTWYLHTAGGAVIKSKHLVDTTGYTAIEHMRRNHLNVRSTFACVSEPLFNLEKNTKNTLFWNTADPYLYSRRDGDRIIVGGRDVMPDEPLKRQFLLKEKTKKLASDLGKIFPAIGFTPQFSWAGTFVTTKDGLPLIGKNKLQAASYVALGFGGNGTTFSAIAGEMISSLINGDVPEFAFLFDPARKF